MERRPLEAEGTERPDEERIADGRDGYTGQALSTEDLVATDSGRNNDSGRTGEDEAQTLFDNVDVDRFRESWQDIQTAFVDDPRRAVKEADELVAVVIQNLATTFADHKKELESAWSQGEPATEDLRIALRRYRSFFNQLLSS
ncbi:hypothetical protein DL991_38530 [Amycolatopsis sp. WAC 01375]|uniref:hypothetical protein n=1 Tax=Amycolatopsis sp. WAC 01375 TaxID=2203194 RepID=UPI000F785855|nr:hypothetical protein [Amycolatopsis sp. WAC 01375]RSM70206.1 hypothetical protein DL991_38530 [Amycolatopsis sp. WAC 01375]